MDAKVVLLLVIGSLCISSNVHASDWLDGIKKCPLADEKCLMGGLDYVLRNHAKTGIKEIGLVKLDPMHIKKYSLAKKPNSPVSIDMTFTNADLIGFNDAQVQRVSGVTQDLSKPVKLQLFFPKIKLEGPYSIEGKVLILPIVGKGKAQIELENVKVLITLKMKPVKKGEGQTYGEILNAKMLLEPSHVKYRLEGLFNNQKELSDNLHTLINDNWKEIFTELQGDIANAMGSIFKSLINDSLSHVQLQKILSDFK